MHKILISSALIMALAGGSAAVAATKTEHSAKPTLTAEQKAKEANCAKQWKGEKAHGQTRKAFMASCMKA